jgi:hypothetical protein
VAHYLGYGGCAQYYTGASRLTAVRMLIELLIRQDVSMSKEESNTDNEILIWIQDWYEAQCDGDWEHDYGVEINTLDNPGWMVKVDLAGTSLEGASFATVDETHRSEDDWMHCEVRDGCFRGAGGTHNLLEILQLFRSWAEGWVQSDKVTRHQPGL